jgi:dephospho-CoA kinase
MKAPLQIGITGGIGSGKSLVCRIFQVLGVPVYDADSRAKSVMTTDGILITQIKKEFGVLSYHENGAVNREYLAKEVFSNPEKLKILNQLVHPRVNVDYARWLTEQQGRPYVLKEAALLYESESYQQLSKIIVVYAPEELRIKRVLDRDKHRTAEQVKAIIHNQLKDEEKKERADFVIVNNETTLVIPRVLELHEQFLEMN